MLEHCLARSNIPNTWQARCRTELRDFHQRVRRGPESILDADALAAYDDAVQHFCLDERKKNAFLVLQKPDHPGYKALATLVDLRFVHLLHPSITTDQAGVRYEAYLLDYSFYTGMRRRQHIEEIRIEGERPKRAELRRLPKIELDQLGSLQERVGFLVSLCLGESSQGNALSIVSEISSRALGVLNIAKKVCERFRGEYEITDIDGVRVKFDEDWGLVQASNTQPVLVLRFEATTQEKLDKYRTFVEGVVEEAKREFG